MAKKDFKSLGGSSRSYVNTKTGEIISRYKYDKLYGTTQEFKGNTHLKAKLNKQAAPEIAASRPAPGRKSTLKEVEKTRGSRIKPLKGKKSRHISIPVKYKYGTIDAAHLEPKYSALVAGLKKNKSVYGASINITFTLHGLIDTKNIFRLRSRRSIPTWGEFVDEIKGGSIPKEFIKPVEKGVTEAMDKGVVAGYPMVDVQVTLYDGSFHEVDSSEFAFKIAGSMAFQQACRKAKPVILEPVMKMEVVTPEDFFGQVISDLSSRRGQIKETSERVGMKVIDATVPLSETFGYATSIRSLTEGRASFTMEFNSYEQVPANVAQEIIDGKRK